MEAVKAFNAELSSLYEVKPPISKAKMTAITRGAIKAIKFYKHVVQSVEKFILKCKQEYKVPGLYVIDSIVRQSRHQFGPDKDVFAPRFAKNIQQTFVNLFKCPAEDKSKIIRVLNLWQKNQVFAPEVIQPLFDLANPNHPIHKELSASTTAANNGLTQGSINIVKGSPALQKSPTKVPQQGADANTLAHLGGVANNPNMLLNADPNVLAHLQQLHRLIVRDNAKAEGQPVHFDRKLLDFDYGEDEEEPQNPSPKVVANNAPHETVASLLANPEVLRHLQTLQQSELDLEKLRKLQEMKQQEEEFDKHLAQTVPNLPFAAECEFKPNSGNSSGGLPSGFFLPPGSDLSQPPPGYKTQTYDLTHQHDEGTAGSEVEFVESNDNGDVEVINLDHGDSLSPSPRDDRYNRRRRSRSRDRSRERRRLNRRSRSRSHSRSRRHRTRSRSRSRDRDKEKDKEKEKERKKRGLPPIKKDNLSVCSTTLWVGHLSKLVYQEELYNTFGEFGDVVSIDLIPPRGCAFIVMHRRQDAARCLTKLKNQKLQGKAITLAWAPGKGVKGKDLKDYWEGDLGVSYIPWSKIKQDIDLEMLEDGGMIDEDTMPPWMKAKLELNAPPPTEKILTDEVKTPLLGTPNVDTTQPPPVPTAGLLQPPPLTLPLVNPFQLNNSILGPVGMNLPPGMMPPNVPIGVPPPNISQATAMLNNALLGLNSPFAQGPPPNLLQMQMAAENKTTPEQKIQSLSDQLLSMSHSFVMASQAEDNMDIEMEDANKPDLFGGDVMHNRPNAGGMQQNFDDQRDRRDDRDRDNRGRRGSRSRDRGRDRDRDRNHRNSRDRGKDRNDRKDDNRRDRWNDRDRRDRDERRERSEKSVNDRLWEMAEGYSSRDRPRDMNEIPEPAPPLLDKPDFPPRENHMNFDNMEPEFDDGFRRGGPPGPVEFEPPMHRQHDNFHPMPEPLLDMPPEFERPPRMHHDEFEHEQRFNRRDRRGGGDGFVDERRMMDDFDNRGPPMRGPGPEFFPPPRDGFGPPPPRGPLIRGPGPDAFPPRGPRGPGPRMFHPRGPLLRGPRPGPPWMDGGGMRHKFPPRFDGPGEFFRGPPGPMGPPGLYDDAPHPRHRRYDDNNRRRHNRPDYDADKERERPERNSRWSSGSPRQDDGVNVGGAEDEGRGSGGDGEDGGRQMEEDSREENAGGESGGGGNTTPLHDEPQEPQRENEVVDEAAATAVVVEEAAPQEETPEQVNAEQ